MLTKRTVAEAEKAGIEKAGGQVTIYQCAAFALHTGIISKLLTLVIPRVPETLGPEVLTKMGAPPKPDYPTITTDILTDLDAFLIGIPTRFGNFPAQWKVRV